LISVPLIMERFQLEMFQARMFPYSVIGVLLILYK
jgi:hypothetical protein